MGWGQLLGGAAGFFLGGPAGAALGASLGGAAEEVTGGGASGAAREAAATTGAAADRATALQERMYEEGVARQKPFYDAGVNALPGYLKGIGQNGELVRGFTQADYQADPGYAFRMSEGMKALEGSAAARGGLLSGNALRGIQRYGQDMASQEYSNAYTRFRDTQGLRRNALAGVVGFAPTAAGAMTSSGQNYAANAGNIGMGQSNVAANALLAGQQARSSSYGQLGNVLGKYLGGGGSFGGSSGSFQADPGAYAFGTQYWE